MNNTAPIREALLADLGSDGAGLVACLSGTWGCGKTHLWHDLATALRDKGKTTAYVSLFGLTSVADAKAAIVNELVLGEHANTEGTTKSRFAKMGQWAVRQAPGILQALDHKVGFELLSKNLDLTRLISANSIVCLDDLERISAQFRLEDALGLANMLAEQRDCRVLLIMNEEHLEERFSNEAPLLRAYRERVVRRFFRIETDLPGVLPHILSAYRLDLPRATAEIVVDTLVAAHCGNIRTLLRALEHVRRLLDAAGTLVQPNDIRLCTALTAEHALGTLRKADFYAFEPIVFAVSRRRPDEAIEPTQAEQAGFLAKYFGSPNAHYRFDAEIHRFLERGFLRTTEFKANLVALAGPTTSVGLFLARINGGEHRFLSDGAAASWIAEATTLLNQSELTAHDIAKVVLITGFVARRAGTQLPPELTERAEESLIAAARRQDRSLDPRIWEAEESQLVMPLVEAYVRELSRVADTQLRMDLLESILARDVETFRRTARADMPASAQAILDLAVLSEFHATLQKDRRFYFEALEVLGYIVGQTHAAALRDGLLEYWAVMLAWAPLDNGDIARITKYSQELQAMRWAGS